MARGREESAGSGVGWAGRQVGRLRAPRSALLRPRARVSRPPAPSRLCRRRGRGRSNFARARDRPDPGAASVQRPEAQGHGHAGLAADPARPALRAAESRHQVSERGGPRCAEAETGLRGWSRARTPSFITPCLPPSSVPSVFAPPSSSPVSVPRLPLAYPGVYPEVRPCLPPSAPLPPGLPSTRSPGAGPPSPDPASRSPSAPPPLRPGAVRRPGAEPAPRGGTRASELLPILPEPRSAWRAPGPWPQLALGRSLAGGCPTRRGLRALQAGAAGWMKGESLRTGEEAAPFPV